MKWEYNYLFTIGTERDLVKKLNEYGEKGWEVINITTQQTTGSISYRFTVYFKRQIQ